MPSCPARVTDLNRHDRTHIAWDTTGLDPETDTAFVSIEGGPRRPLTVGTGQVVGYFAGPDYASPGSAIVVPQTSWVEVVVVTETETLTFPGGFIRLTT